MSDIGKKIHKLVSQMRRDALLEYAKKTFPPGTPQQSFTELLIDEVKRRADKNKRNKTWNTSLKNIENTAAQIYPTWKEWSEQDES